MHPNKGLKNSVSEGFVAKQFGFYRLLTLTLGKVINVRSIPNW